MNMRGRETGTTEALADNPAPWDHIRPNPSESIQAVILLRNRKRSTADIREEGTTIGSSGKIIK